MLKYIRKWYKDLNEAQQLLNEAGIFTSYHAWGTYVHYIDPDLSKHINTKHDKQNTISKND